MSLQSQIALGKNMSLQRQLDGKYVEYKKAFRTSRRRLDSLEEECISSLYKLLTEAIDNKKAGEPDNKRTTTPDANKVRSRGPSLRSQSVLHANKREDNPVPVRPHTSMSSRTYKQSYSFKTDGLDISNFTKARQNTRKKQETQKNVENPLAVIRPYSSVHDSRQVSKSETEQSLQQIRAQSAMVQRNNRLTQTEKENDVESQTDINSEKPDIQNLDTDEVDAVTRPTTSILKHRKGTPVLVKVHESNTQIDEFRPLSVKITQTSPLEHPIYKSHGAPTPRPNTRMGTPFEEELLPLMADEERSKSEMARRGDMMAVGSRLGGVSRNGAYPRSMAPSRTESEESAVMKARSIQEHQRFLAEYSKRSKLFGYVVKTKSSIIFNKKGGKVSRSPYVTYQELVSIKSSMKQQETRTRMLLNRSAKLSSYVDQLAMASQYRQHIKSLKEGKSSEPS